MRWPVTQMLRYIPTGGLGDSIGPGCSNYRLGQENSMKVFKQLAVAAALAATLPAFGAVVYLDFEGIGDGNPVGDYYNGGGGTELWRELQRRDAGARRCGRRRRRQLRQRAVGRHDHVLPGREQRGPERGGWLRHRLLVLLHLVHRGDGDGVRWSRRNRQRARHARPLRTVHDNCTGDPTGAFCNWTAVGVAFAGIAKSIDFGGTANQTGFDNITFGADTPVVPEPSTYALMALGLAGIGLVARRRQRS